MPKRIDLDRDRVRAMLEAGATYRDIGLAMGVCQARIWREAKRLGVSRGQGWRAHVRATRAQLEALVSQGVSRKEMATSLGVPYHYVAQRLRELGMSASVKSTRGRAKGPGQAQEPRSRPGQAQPRVDDPDTPRPRLRPLEASVYRSPDRRGCFGVEPDSDLATALALASRVVVSGSDPVPGGRGNPRPRPRCWWWEDLEPEPLSRLERVLERLGLCLSPSHRHQIRVRLDASEIEEAKAIRHRYESVAEMARDFGITPERMERYLSQPVPVTVTADDSDGDSDDVDDDEVEP